MPVSTFGRGLGGSSRVGTAQFPTSQSAPQQMNGMPDRPDYNPFRGGKYDANPLGAYKDNTGTGAATVARNPGSSYTMGAGLAQTGRNALAMPGYAGSTHTTLNGTAGHQANAAGNVNGNGVVAGQTMDSAVGEDTTPAYDASSPNNAALAAYGGGGGGSFISGGSTQQAPRQYQQYQTRVAAPQAPVQPPQQPSWVQQAPVNNQDPRNFAAPMAPKGPSNWGTL